LHLFTPAAGEFSFTDTIAVRVQLAGSVRSLREFLLPRRPHSDAAATEVRVSLVRQLLLRINDTETCQPCEYTLGSAVLVPTPPCDVAHDQPDRIYDDGVSLDWSGEVRCEDTAVGRSGCDVASFDAGIVKVQDFIMVDVDPGPKSQFTCVKHSYRMRYVGRIASSS
jgi:hypothetical protein